MADQDPRVMLVPELAKEAGVSRTNIRQLLRKGLLRGRKHGSTWVIPIEEAQRYLEGRKGRKRSFFGRGKKWE